MRGNRELQKLDLSLTVRKANEPYRVTFVSQIDGSVQYYAVNPSLRAGAGQALFLSLHGASVEAIGQAQAYSNKGWGHLVAPTNRRPFGFDWEDIGRLDALEVLDLAQKQLLTDRSRTYLTGHSMGGHGTWNLGVLFPGLFAAIAPSAGWESFESYGGGERFENPSGAALAISRSNAPSRTLDFVRNLKGLGIYVLHGDADTNVPVTEARKMVSALKEFHSDFQVHEEKGADHWWDKNPEPGADAVDWAPFFSLFSRRRIAPSREVLAVDFRTPHPGVSASRDWVTIHQQVTPFVPSHVSITCSPLLRRFEGYTENVATLEIWPDPLTQGGNWTVVLDGGNPITVTQTDKPVFLRRRPEGWQATEAPGKLEKGPHRNGGFKDVFRNRVVFVIGTKTEEAATWAEAKARYDAETFLVRGNGSVDIVTDREFNPRAFRDRNILLYGGPEINSAYDKVVDRSELKSQVSNNVASFFILPRKDSAVASVGVINGSSMVGLRLAERVPLFGSGAGMPDYLVIEPKMLLERYSGVIGAGFFDNSWR
jgi:poly(3-hydroxybutyrate) depolymerase